MADDQGPKISSIDELVNELTKKNPGPSPAPAPRPIPSSPSSGPSASPQVPKPKFTAPPPPPMPRPAPSIGSGPSAAPAPRAASPSAPASGPATGPKPSTPPVKEYQSSIRTMKEDISTLKQGQKPAGVDVPRKIETITPAPSVPKPAVPGQAPQFKMPSANLGQAEKTAPLPQVKSPTASPTPVPPQKPQIYVPPASPSSTVGSGNSSRLFMLIAGGVLLGGALYWLLVLRVSEPEIVIESPTPTPVPTQIVRNLSDIFPVPAYAVTLQEDKYAESLKTGVSAMTVEGGTFTIINAEDIQGRDILWTEYVMVPQQVQDSLGGEMMVLAYGQKEIFSQNGQLNPSAQTEERLVIVIEAKDSSFAGQGLVTWEPTMVADLQQLFTLNPTKQASATFLLTNYQGTTVKYKNFPHPDRSIDYGVVSASNGKSYIVISNSRESMFSVADVLTGAKKLSPFSSPSPSPSVSP